MNADQETSKKLNVLIALTIRLLMQDRDFGKTRNKGVGELANYLVNFGLDAKDIAEILSSPLPSIRTLLTPKRRKK
jgi:hypothetical protein